jgi:hypothetical protein
VRLHHPRDRGGRPTLHTMLSGTVETTENISRGPTFVDFVTIRTEASMLDVTVARLQTPLSPLF